MPGSMMLVRGGMSEEAEVTEGGKVDSETEAGAEPQDWEMLCSWKY